MTKAEISRNSYLRNKAKVLARSKERYYANHELRKAQKKQWVVNADETQRQKMRSRRSEWGKKNKAHENARMRAARHALKVEVFARYGGKCVQCTECRLDRLALDHVHNDGANHRKLISSSTSTQRWARRNGFPNTLQILCHNHNTKKERLRRGGDSPTARRDQRIRKEALSVYGMLCTLCGESDPDMLELDHVGGGGTKHRIAERIKNLAKWAKRNEWPAIFRTLCANCNQATHMATYSSEAA